MRQRGFTLIELMIVVALIAVIAAIAIPALLNSRKSANETRAIATLRTVTTAQEQYRMRFGTYADSMSRLQTTGFTAIAFDAYSTIGYTATQSAWSLSAGPTTPADGDRYFFTDQTGVIRFSSSGPATATSLPVE